jgi:hypothetical protein
MKPTIESAVTLLPENEQQLRFNRVRTLMKEANLPAILISDNANTYYLTGRVFSGYIYLPLEGMPVYFIHRPVQLTGDGVVYIHKPELIAESLGLNMPQKLGLELDLLPYTAAIRLEKIFAGSEIVNASPLLRAARSVKTEYELERIKLSGIKQMSVYAHIPKLYRDGMTDLELQIEIERRSRLEGCLGQFRISGDSMELFMGSVLTGENADTPCPYDFAMGGGGLDPSIPVGADETVIRNGYTVMVDVNGNYTGYMTDMTRTYYLEDVSDEAKRAHQCSIDICKALEKIGVPGTPAKQLYETAQAIVRERNLEKFFMGHKQHAPFIGHGIGIEINELPIIAPRSRDILAAGNVIALEPKFVIPKVGAVGIENSYVVTDNGLINLTPAPEQLMSLI